VELLGANGDGDGGADPGRWDAFPVGNAHGEAGARRGLEAEATCSIRGDEGVSGSRVHQSPDGCACDGCGQVHGVRRLDAGEGVDGDLDVVGRGRLLHCSVLNWCIIIELHQVQALLHAGMVLREFFWIVEAEALCSALGHLLLC